MNENVKIKEQPLIHSFECPFCHGMGIAKSVKLFDPMIPNGSYDLGELVDKYGDYTECCEGCLIMN